MIPFCRIRFNTIKNRPLRWLVALLLSKIIVVASIASLQAREVKDLALGVALYEFFQQEDFAALSEILIAEETQRLNNQADFASQFAAGIMLSYGMDQASQERLLVNQATGFVDAENQARSNYYLAKLLYRKGQHNQAFELLHSIDDSLTDSLKPELSFLLHSSFIKGDQSPIQEETNSSESVEEGKAKPRLEFSKAKEKGLAFWSNYLDYNLSIGEANKNIQALEQLAQRISGSMQRLSLRHEGQKASFDELLALRDRALLSVAYLYLSQNQSDKAIKHLRAYSADGLEVDQALLAYGWAYLQREEFSEALAAWQSLAGGDIGSPATRESLLGIPYIYELQGEQKNAAQAYENAIDRLNSELLNLDNFSSALTDKASSSFLDALQNSRLSWLEDYDAKAVSEIDSSQLDILSRLRAIASTDEFILSVNQYRDSNWLLEQSEQWFSLINAMRNSIENQQARFSEVFEKAYQSKLQASLSRLEKHFNQLTLQLGQLKTRSGRAYFSEKLFTREESERYQKAGGLQEKLQKLSEQANGLAQSQPSHEKLAKFSNASESRYATARLLAGSQLWMVAEQSEQRIWQMTKSLKQTEAALLESQNNASAIELMIPQLQSQKGALAKIDSLEQRLLLIRSDLSSLKQSVSNELLRTMRAELEQQKATLNSYLAQAQLARARLLDSLYMESDAAGNSESEKQGGDA